MIYEHQLYAVLFDYIERYGLSELAREYLFNNEEMTETSKAEFMATDKSSQEPEDSRQSLKTQT